MENLNVTDNAVHGVTDISGVKDAAPFLPDGEVRGEPCVADTAEGCAFSSENAVAGAIEAQKESENGNAFGKEKTELEAEFEALIGGKYRDVYKRKTESIIRKRLRSGKAHPECSSKDAKSFAGQGASENAAPACVEGSASSMPIVTAENDATVGGVEAKNTSGYDAVREKNRNRPLENGLTGSCGIVTKINVSALDGEGILSILRRVGSGEKISFK